MPLFIACGCWIMPYIAVTIVACFLGGLYMEGPRHTEPRYQRLFSVLFNIASRTSPFIRPKTRIGRISHALAFIPWWIGWITMILTWVICWGINGCLLAIIRGAMAVCRYFWVNPK